MKTLITIMGHQQLIDTCETEPWRVPFQHELEGTEYSGWVQSPNASTDTRLAYYHNGDSQSTTLVNKNWLMPVTVIRLDKFVPAKRCISYLLLVVAILIFMGSQVLALEPKCEQAITEAVIVHVKYMEGNVTLADSYNATAIVKGVCDD